jgi:hypothetical protein
MCDRVGVLYHQDQVLLEVGRAGRIHAVLVLTPDEAERVAVGLDAAAEVVQRKRADRVAPRSAQKPSKTLPGSRSSHGPP